MTTDHIQRVRIFISSPSDVAEERQAVLKAIDDLNRLAHIKARYHLQPLAYEYETPPASGIAQLVVDEFMGEPKDSYLVICILWSKMGTPFIHPVTQIHYQSGTEYEFMNAYQSWQTRSTPHILLYRRTDENPNATPEQRQQVQTFFRRFEGSDAEFKQLYKPYANPQEFAQFILVHIDTILNQYPPSVQPSLPPENQLETIQAKRVRLQKIQDGTSAEAQTLRSEIRRELRTILSPLPPARYMRFVGRQEKIRQTLDTLADVDSPPIIAIDGIGGSGKTALAREVSKLALDKNLFEAVVWESDKPMEFTGSGIHKQETAEINFDNLLDRVARHLGFFDVTSLKTTQLKREYLERVFRDERFLVVIDNLETMKGYRELVNNLRGMVTTSKLMFTTRNKIIEPFIYTMTLSGMEREDAFDFLRTLAKGRGDAGAPITNASESLLDRIYQATGGLPLAMEMLVGQIARSSPTAVLKRIESVNFTNLVDATEDVYTQFFSFIYKNTWEQLSDDARLVLIAMGSYDPVEGARYSLLQDNLKDMLTLDMLENALTELAECSLLIRRYEADEENLYLHPLTRSFVRTGLGG